MNADSASDPRPKARTDSLATEAVGNTVVMVDARSGMAYELHPLTAFVWHHANGERSVADLVHLARSGGFADADTDAVWRALDALGSADLLLKMAAPPVGPQRLDRRALLQRISVVPALAMLPVSPLLAGSDTGGTGGFEGEQADKEQSEKGSEQAEKEVAEQMEKDAAEQLQKDLEEQIEKDSEQQEKAMEEQFQKDLEEQLEKEGEQLVKE